MRKASPKAKKNLSREQFGEIAGLFAVLSDPTRLQIIDALRRSESSVGELCEVLGQKQANVSKHLSILATSGLVAKQSRGTSAIYRLSSPVILKLCDIVCGHLESHAKSRLELLRNR